MRLCLCLASWICFLCLFANQTHAIAITSISPIPSPISAIRNDTTGEKATRIGPKSNISPQHQDSSRLIRRVDNVPPKISYQFEGMTTTQEQWTEEVLQPLSSITEIWHNILRVLYNNDLTLPRPPVPNLAYMIRGDDWDLNRNLVQDGDDFLVIFNIKIALRIYAEALARSRNNLLAEVEIEAELDAAMRGDDPDRARAMVDVNDDAHANARAATRLAITGLLQYFATAFFQWRVRGPARLFAAGVQEWVCLRAGYGMLEWGKSFAAPKPGQDPAEPGAMAYFFDWLHETRGGSEKGISAGSAVNAELRRGDLGKEFWDEAFGMPFDVLWQGYQIHLRSLHGPVVGPVDSSSTD